MIPCVSNHCCSRFCLLLNIENGSLYNYFLGFSVSFLSDIGFFTRQRSIQIQRSLQCHFFTWQCSSSKRSCYTQQVEIKACLSLVSELIRFIWFHLILLLSSENQWKSRCSFVLGFKDTRDSSIYSHTKKILQNAKWRMLFVMVVKLYGVRSQCSRGKPLQTKCWKKLGLSLYILLMMHV